MKENTTLVLDVGTEAVKSLVFQKYDRKIKILGSSLEYFDNYGIFNSLDFKRDVFKKTISKAVKRILPFIGEGYLQQISRNPVFLGLPANILKARIVSLFLKRKTPLKLINAKEEKAIYFEALEKAQKEISQVCSQDFGILPQDFCFINSKILETKIDGYEVLQLREYNGKELEFSILLIFSIKTYLKEIEEVCQAVVFSNNKIIHPPEGFFNYFIIEETGKFPDKLDFLSDGLFLDIGGEITQIFLVKNNKLEKINEFEIGGKIFSQQLAEKFGLQEQDARIFKQRYCQRELSLESSERIKEVLYFPSQIWFEKLKASLKEITKNTLLPSNIVLFGGGSKIPDIKEILSRGNWNNFSFVNKPNVKILYPKDLKNIEDKDKLLIGPQDVPMLLLALY